MTEFPYSISFDGWLDLEPVIYEWNTYNPSTWTFTTTSEWINPVTTYTYTAYTIDEYNETFNWVRWPWSFGKEWSDEYDSNNEQIVYWAKYYQMHLFNWDIDTWATCWFLIRYAVYTDQSNLVTEELS